jgi:hypothetical protein
MYVRRSSGVIGIHHEFVSHEIARLEIEDQAHSFSKFDISSPAVT